MSAPATGCAAARWSVVEGWGGVHPFGNSPALSGNTAGGEPQVSALTITYAHARRALAALEVPYRRAGSGEILLPCPALRRALSPVDISASPSLMSKVAAAASPLLPSPPPSSPPPPHNRPTPHRFAAQRSCRLLQPFSRNA